MTQDPSYHPQRLPTQAEQVATSAAIPESEGGPHVPGYQIEKNRLRAEAPAREAEAKAAEERKRQSAIAFRRRQLTDRLSKVQASVARFEQEGKALSDAAQQKAQEYVSALERVRGFREPSDLPGLVSDLVLAHDEAGTACERLAANGARIEQARGGVALVEYDITALRTGGDSLQRLRLQHWATSGHGPGKAILPGAAFYMEKLNVPPRGTPLPAVIGPRAAEALSSFRWGTNL